jgi:hypothetical protein
MGESRGECAGRGLSNTDVYVYADGELAATPLEDAWGPKRFSGSLGADRSGNLAPYGPHFINKPVIHAQRNFYAG